MSNEQNISAVYHGKWMIPIHGKSGEVVEHRECMGTLTYDGASIKLDVYPDFSILPVGCDYIEVLYGYDNCGNRYTLFDLYQTNIQFGVSASFSVTEVVLGNKIESLSTPVYNECEVVYPYLRNWVHTLLFDITQSDKLYFEAPFDNIQPVKEIELDGSVRLSICHKNNFKVENYQLHYTENVVLKIKSDNTLSINEFKRIITRFTQFLSVAMYSSQSPCDIVFSISTDKGIVTNRMLFEITESEKPARKMLIPFNTFKDRIESLVNKWFNDYEQISPICDYLIRSLEKSVFDAPKFLIVAQALDGYYKRYGEGKCGYEDGIKRLLNRFQKIELIRACNIDATVMAHTRHKYSHLIPDSDNSKNIEKAVSGEELYLLTKKAVVLLTCCILDYIGLTIDEINKCLEGSTVKQIIHYIIEKEKYID